ncbi:MAG TPA: hypothetical protein VFN23_00890, partial [Ktedonobacteraceae bacterium]|nr:hypothetical protein [Ktedonobacteraceae bacterium]
IVAEKAGRGLGHDLHALLSSHYVPAFVALKERGATVNELRTLRKRARFYPLDLSVTFRDGRMVPYVVILGSMAFQVCAEIPYRAICIDRHKTQAADEEPMIC